MLDKYDSLQDKLGYAMDELTIAKKHIDAAFSENHLGVIKNKLKQSGMAHYKMIGYMVGDKFYKVKLQKDDGILLLTIEKDGRLINILEDKTQGGK